MALDTAVLVEKLGKEIVATINPVKELGLESTKLANTFSSIQEVQTRLAEGLASLCNKLLDALNGIKDCVCRTDSGGDDGGLLSDIGTIASIVGAIDIVVALSPLEGAVAIGVVVASIVGGLIALLIMHWDELKGIVLGIGGVLLAILLFSQLVAGFLSLLPVLALATALWLAALLLTGLLLLFAFLASGIGEAAMAIVEGIFRGTLGIIGAIFDRFGWWALLLLPFLLPLLVLLVPLFAILAAIWVVGWLLNWAADHLWDKLSDIWDAVTNIPGEIADAIGGLASGIGDVFGSLLPFQSGGVVPGPRGRGTLVLAHGGEGIFNQDQMAAIGAGAAAGGGAVNVVIDGGGLDRRLLEWLRHAVRVEGGGSAQSALGQ